MISGAELNGSASVYFYFLFLYTIPLGINLPIKVCDMILFENDFFGKHAYVDTKTQNHSFIKTSIVLKRMGISNYKFMLSIYQPDLMGVDPHDPTLTKDIKMKIAYECKINPWYYFREVVRIPTPGSDPVQFQLNRANMCLIWFYYNNIDIYQVIPRQTGKTMGTIAIHSHVIYIMGKNISVSMLTKDNLLRQENVSRLKDIRDGLPDYLVFKQTKDSDNKEGISYTAFGNRYLTFVAQNDLAGADNLGRGMTTPTQHFDEVGMFKNIAVTYPVALNSTNAAVETAKANNQPHSNILTTTAGKLDTPEGRFAHSLLSNALTFSEKLYDVKDREELKEIVDKGSSNGMVYSVFSYLQLGKTHEWFKEKSSRSNATQDDIDRDYLNIWKLGTMKSILSQEMLGRLKAAEKEPLYTELVEGYVVRWYIEKYFVQSNHYKDIPLILGMDSSENIGRDFTALVLMDARDMSLVATVRCNESNIIKMAMFISNLLLKYEKTLFIPERHSTGAAIIDLVVLELQKHGINPFRRIFSQVIQNKDDKQFANFPTNGRDAVDGRVRKFFGFKTTGSTRPYLYKTVFNKALELNVDKFCDKDLIEEISTLSVKNGRIDHLASGHDDMVIAYLLACYVLFAGKNLDFYGIDQKLLLSQVSESTSEEETEVGYQQRLRIQIQDLETKINSANSELVRMSLIKKMNGLKLLVDPSVPAIISSDISEEKKRVEEDALKQRHKPKYNPDLVLDLVANF